MIALLLVACIPHRAPTLWPVDVPTPEPPPALEELPELEGETPCPEVAPYLPGRQAPWVTAQGIATCRAQVVPERVILELRACPAREVYWSRIALASYAARKEERGYAQAWIQDQALDDARKEARTLRAGTVGSYALGIGTGLAAAWIAARAVGGP